MTSVENQVIKSKCPHCGHEFEAVPKPKHLLLCGDSTKAEDVARVMQGEKARMVFTDPPYGVAYQDDMDTREAVARHRRRDGAIVQNDKKTVDELRPFLFSAFNAMPLVDGGAFYVCAPSGDRYIAFLLALEDAKLPMHQGIVWVKQQMVFGRQDYHYKHELIIYGWREGASHYFVDDRTQTSVWEIDRPQVSKEHPTMKPVELVARAVENSSKPGDVVYEPFSGSGTTLIACENLKRKCRAIEISPGYVAVALERWSQATGKTPELITT